MLGTASPRSRALAGGDLALVLVIAVVVAVVATVWLAGELAALLTSGQTIAVGPGQLGRVLARLPEHLDDPSRAWPADARRSLPGPVGCYLAAVVVIIALGGGMVALVRAWRSPALGGRDRRGSRWANAGDLRRLRVRTATPGRLTLGRVGRGLVATEKRHSAIVIAPTQSLKTTGLAVPALLEWHGPVLAASIKTDLVHHTHRARRKAGEVMIFDPADTTGMCRARPAPPPDCSTSP